MGRRHRLPFLEYAPWRERLVVAFGDTLHDDLFKEKLGKHTARSISRSAKERNAGTFGYAETMLAIYNRNLKAPLHWSRLHAPKPAFPEETPPANAIVDVHQCSQNIQI